MNICPSSDSKSESVTSGVPNFKKLLLIRNSTTCLDSPINRPSDETFIHDYAANGNILKMKQVLEYYPDLVNSKDSLVSYYTCCLLLLYVEETAKKCNQIDSRIYFSSRNFTVSLFGMVQMTGWTALSCAANYGHDEVVELLLERGAIVNTRDNVSLKVVAHCPRIICCLFQ